MSVFGFGKRFKNRQFEYNPRFYDPDKEDLQNRLRKYSDDEPDQPELMKARIRGGLKRKYRVSGDITKKANRRSNIILLLVLAGLLLLTVFFISEYLPRIITALE